MGNKTSILHILYALFPLNYERYIEPFGGSGAVLLGKKKPDKFEVYNDYKLEKYLAEKSDKELKINLAKIAGVTVNVIIVIFFVVEGINLLKLEVLTNIGTTIIAYLPNILAALLVIILCIIAGSLLDKFISNKTGSKVYGLIVKVAVFIVGAFIILNQLHIATTIVNSAFIIILCALAVAFAIAFGIGGREFASHTLKKLENRMLKDSDKKDDAKK